MAKSSRDLAACERWLVGARGARIPTGPSPELRSAVDHYGLLADLDYAPGSDSPESQPSCP